MEPLDPGALLDHPDLVGAAAPWCTRLDGVELALLLLCLPWLAGPGLRPADLERRLRELERELPVGPVYFQRIRRAVRRLETVGAVEGSGAARSMRYRATPTGLAALVLNLAVPATDPTIDGSDFELKHALASMAGAFSGVEVEVGPGAGSGIDSPPAREDDELSRFFERAERLTVLGSPVLTDELIGRAFDVLALIESQRDRVLALLQAAKSRRPPLALRAGLADALDHLDPEALTSSLAAIALQRSIDATVERYRSYLVYLDSLTRLYSEASPVLAHATL
jgi:hypothetical protein